MKPSHSLFILLLPLIGCTGTGYQARKAPPPATVTVGVKQFQTGNYASMSAPDRGVRDYEHLAFPAMLVDALNSSPGVQKAYFVPADTPSVDLIVEGSIEESNGRDVRIKLTAKRIDGKVLGSKTATVVHSDTNVAGIKLANARLFKDGAASVVATKQKYDCDRDDLRALVYADAKNSPSTPELNRMGQEAASVERSQLLAPLTSTLNPRIAATSQTYFTWQKESVPFVTQKKAAEAQKSAAEAQEMVGAFLGGLYSGLGAGMAASGDATGLMASTMLATQGFEMSAEGAANKDIAGNKVNELAAALGKLKTQFVIGPGREITVRIYDKVVKLRGSKEQMVKEFQQVVRQEMAKKLGSAPASTEAAPGNPKT